MNTLDWIDISAPQHGPDAKYRVSYGIASWGNTEHHILAIHMLYGDKVVGNMSPYMVLDADPHSLSEYDQIHTAMSVLKARNKK